MTHIPDTITHASAHPEPMPLEPCPPGKNERAWELAQIALRAKRLAAAIEEVERLCEARFNMEAGSSRAAITTAHAKCARAKEERDRCRANFEYALWHSAYGRVAR